MNVNNAGVTLATNQMSVEMYVRPKATYDGTMMRVFFDGQERLAVPSSTVLANPNDFKMGGRPQNTYLNGELDEIRVSNVARTLPEILARYCP